MRVVNRLLKNVILGKKNGVPRSAKNPKDITIEYIAYSRSDLSFLKLSDVSTTNATKNTAEITALIFRAITRLFIVDLNAVDKSISTSSEHIASVVDTIIRLLCLYELQLFVVLVFLFAIFS